MRLNAFKTDETLETKGVWFDVAEGLRIRVARMHNTKHRACLRELMRPHLQRIRRGNLDIAIVEKMTRQAMAKTILLDWENLEDDDGEPIPYSKEKALEALEQYPEFVEIVTNFAQDIENYREEVRADAEGN